jgi:hypothetical protein
MKTRNIINANNEDTSEPFAVSQHIILRNMWEYYLEEPDKDGIAFGFVMGFENEWGSVDLKELKPYIISKASGSELNEVMAPAGYVWEDEDEDWQGCSHFDGYPGY